MNELTYTKNGDVLIPNLVAHLPVRALGKYGRMRGKYLKEQRPILYNRLVLRGQLFDHLLDAEDSANARLDALLPRLAQSAGATETLKAADPIAWVGLMNACKAQAEEIILKEIVYE